MKLVLYPNSDDQRALTVPGRAVTLGAADDNTIVLTQPGVADYHARLVCEDDDWYLVDLRRHGDVELDGVPVTRGTVTVGAHIRLAGIDILVASTEVIGTEIARVEPVASSVAIAGGTSLAEGCPRCGAQVAPNARFCPQCGGGMVTAYAGPVVQRPGGDSGVVPRLALIFALCGPLLLGIGWLVGGILGIVAVARGRSLMLSPNDRRTAWWSIVISLLWVAVLGGLVGFGTFRYVTEAVIKRNETQVANLLRGIALTQYYIKYSELLDADADGISEYAWPAQLLSSGYHKVTVDLADHSVQHGYHVLIRNADEKSFLCTAVPVRYGLTGRRSYRIDEQGILVSGDVGGGDLPRTADSALGYTQSQPVLDDVTEEFANDLAHAAEQAFDQGAYARCKRIIANVRSMFPQTEAAQRLTVLEATTDPFLLEFKSKELFQRARHLLDQELVDPAIETLRTIVREFPGASVAGQAKQLITESTVSRARENIEEAEQLLRDGQAEQALAVLQQTERRYPEAAVAASLKDRIAACQAEVMKMLEQDALALLEKARACETEGKFEEAYNIYLTVQTRYGKTVAASSVGEALQKNRRMIEESEAARLIDDILELDPEQDAKRLLSLLDLLSRGYARTEKYKANQSLLDSLQRACQAHRYVTAARDYLKENSYRAALANLELAIKEDPNIALTMGDELEQCYLRLANASYESQNYADALQYYQNYLRLHPQDNLANHKRLMECSFQVAKARLQSGEYQEAEKLLLSCAELYGTDPEYNYVYGRVLARLGRWEDAAQRLASCFSVDVPFARDARVRWAYCQYRCAIDQEEALRRAIYDDDDYLKLVNDYGVTFDLAQRTNVLGGTPGALRATPGKSFADLAIEVCSQLDALAIEAEKLTHSSKGTTEQRLVQRTKIRAMILEMPNQLNILRASASADAYRKAKVLEQLGEVRRLYAALKLALGQINDQMRNPELIRLLTGLTAKLSALAKAEESFGLYNGLIEQRRRRVIAIVENLVSELNPTSANASVLKGRADAIRQLYATSKETDLAVQSLRAFAEAYAVLPPIAGLMLPEPATGIAAPAADTRAAAK